MNKYLLAGAGITALIGAASFGVPYAAAQSARGDYGKGKGMQSQNRLHAADKQRQQAQNPDECDGTRPQDGTGKQHSYGR